MSIIKFSQYCVQIEFKRRKNDPLLGKHQKELHNRKRSKKIGLANRLYVLS